MAQVTMDSKEYLEMVEKIRHLEQVEKDMLNNVEVMINLKSSYNKCSINITPTFTAKIQKQVVSKIVETIIEEPIVMDHLFKENSHYLNLKSGYIGSNWYNESRGYEVDLFTDKAFEAAWDKAKQRAEAAEVKCEIVEKCIDEEEE